MTAAHFQPSADEIAQDHTAAIAENANRSAHFQPIGGGYDEPFIEVAGVKAFLEVDEQHRYCVGVWDDSNGEHFTGPDGQPTILVEVDGQQVWPAPATYAPPCTPVTVAGGGQQRRFGVELAYWLTMLASLAAASVASLGPRSWSTPLFVASAVMVAAAGGLLWASMRRPRRANVRQLPAPHPVDALSEEARLDLLRRVFNLLEYGNQLGQGPAGVEHGSDELNEIEQVFAHAGIPITDPEV